MHLNSHLFFIKATFLFVHCLMCAISSKAHYYNVTVWASPSGLTNRVYESWEAMADSTMHLVLGMIIPDKLCKDIE